MSGNQFDNKDPLDFMRGMWNNMGFSLPGMVTPTLDVDELEKRIADLKAVEGWLRMNLSMLQMTIQGLEMQKTTLSAVKAMGQMAQSSVQATSTAEAPAAEGEGLASAFSQAAMWPWQMMQQMQTHLQQAEAPAKDEASPAPANKPAAKSRRTKSQ